MIVIDECHKLRRFAIGRNRPRVVIAIEHEPDSRIVFLIGNRGENLVSQSTKEVKGENGDTYLVTTDENGYTITNQKDNTTIGTAPKFDGVQYKNIGNYCQFIYGDNVECDEYKFVYEFDSSCRYSCIELHRILER